MYAMNSSNVFQQFKKILRNQNLSKFDQTKICTFQRNSWRDLIFYNEITQFSIVIHRKKINEIGYSITVFLYRNRKHPI